MPVNSTETFLSALWEEAVKYTTLMREASMFPIIAELDYELCDKDLIPSILLCRWIASSLFTTLAVNMTASRLC